MASKSRIPSQFLIVGFIVAILLLMGTTIYALFQTQQTQQHAALAQYTSIAISGNIYVDTNKNGQKDTGEVNYTGNALPKVKLALFSQTCPTPTTKPTPTPKITPTPAVSVTPPPNCYYRTLCPRFACTKGGPCPTCAPTLVCVTPRPSGAHEGGTGAVSTGQIQVIQGNTSDVKGVSDSTVPQGEGNDQGNGLCREIPQQFVDCTVSKDGTYLCSAPNVQPFTSASISIEAPAFYKVTSKNPVIISAAAATVDFGLTPSGIYDSGNGPSQQGMTSGNKLPFTIHVNGVTAGLPVVLYITEAKEDGTPVSGVLTTDTSGNIVIKATPNDQITIVPVASKGYTTITPQRLQVTVSQNSCGLSSPCLFSATK